MAKILVDEMPEIPEQCPFAVTKMAKCIYEWCEKEIEIPVNFCVLSERICENTENCEFLKAE